MNASIRTNLTKRVVKQDQALYNEQRVFKAEYFLSICLVLAMGFLGSQKLIQSLWSKSSAVNVYAAKAAVCEGGFRLPGVSCQQVNVDANANAEATQDEKEKHASSADGGAPQGLAQTINKVRMVEPLPNAGDRSLREQFAALPDLKSAILQLRWTGNNDQEAARLLSIIGTLGYGRQADSYQNQFAAPAIVKLLDPVWEKYPDLVAASHCLYCGSFFEQVTVPLVSSGTWEEDWLKRIMAGHPRLLRVVYDAGQVDIQALRRIAALQAELLSAGDGQTPGFIGDILLSDGKLDLLHTWSTKGLNGHYAFASVQDLDSLPRDLIKDAWYSAVRAGDDSPRLTRYLVAHGYRPALRWLIWLAAGNVKYIQSYQYSRNEKDRYQAFLKTYLDFPVNSFTDLAGFYSENWQKITWDKALKRWILRR